MQLRTCTALAIAIASFSLVSCSTWLNTLKSTPEGRQLLASSPPKVSKTAPTEEQKKPEVPALKKRILVLHFLNKTPYGGKTLVQGVDALVRAAVSKCSECIVVKEEEVQGAESFAEE